MSCRSRSLAASVLVALALLAPVAGAAAPVALPDELRRTLDEPAALGSGTLRWLGLHVYDATLWVKGASWSADGPYALDIRYARNIPGAKLAQTSVQEMRRMGTHDEARLARWEQAMNRLFPDVKPGDRLIGINAPGRGARFYLGARYLGSVDDSEFAQAFFSIWLGERTRKPELRALLLGRHGPTH